MMNGSVPEPVSQERRILKGEGLATSDMVAPAIKQLVRKISP